MSKLSVSRVSPSNTIWLMECYFDEAPMGWWWSVSLDKKAFNCSGIFIVAHTDHTHHGVWSSGKPLDMVSICLQQRMMWWRSSPNAGLPVLPEVNYEACKSSLVYRSLLAFRNLGNQHRGRSTQGTGRFQNFIYHHWHVYQVDGSYASGKYHPRCSSQVPVEYYIQVWHTQVGPNR
jgi:hypothetical protein